MKRVAIACMCLVLASCATTVTPTSGASQGALLSASAGQSLPGTVPITFKRDSGFMGGACSQRLYVNGSAVADLRAGQLVVIHLKPGAHIVGARPNGICGGGDAEAEIVVRDGQARSFRIGADQSGSLRIQPTAF